MTETSGDLADVNEADAIEQAQTADGGLDDSTEDLDTEDFARPQADRMDADEADVLEQARTVKPARDEEYPTADEV
jgi:hypothetical protein